MSNINSHIALVVTDQETNSQIKNLGVGLLELRADLFKKLDLPYIIDQIKRRKLLKTPLLLTLRNQKNEGAVRIFSEEKKRQIITAALPLVDMIDIELSSSLLKQVVAMARKLKAKVIVSSHYLQGMPRDLEPIFKKSLSAKGDFVKIAAKANSFEDVMTMINFTHRHRKQNIITMSLGPWGMLSRLVLPAAGSRYTYTFLNKPTASGQVDVATLKSHLKAYYPA
jgi:3-dehydroquinate dehydratase type I